VRVSVSLLKLLTLFLNRPDELVTRDQIADTLWQDQVTVDVVTGINTTVRRLREVLEDDSSSPRYIATVIGFGYRFIADVKVTDGPAPLTELASPPNPQPNPQSDATVIAAPLAIAADVQEAPPVTETRNAGLSHGLQLLAALLAVALLAGVGIAFGRHHRISPAHPQPAHASIPVKAATQISFNNEDNKVTAEVISPNGHLLAYSDHFGTTLHSLDNGSEQLLTSPAPFVTERISWHPREDTLVVSGVDPADRKSMVWTVFLRGTPPQLLFRDAGMATVSPDGSAIAYTRSHNTELWVSDGHGQNSRLLVPAVDGKSIAGLLWSPGSNRLVFNRRNGAADADAAKPSTAAKSGVTQPDSYESVDAVTGRLLSTQPRVRFDSGILLKDGRFLFAVNPAPGEARLMMVQTDPNTGRFLSDPQPVPASQAWLGWGSATESLSSSANGEKIGAILNLTTTDIYWADIQMPSHTLSGEKRLTGDLAPAFPHAWSPPGDAVVFDGSRRHTWQIATQRLGEAASKVLTTLPKTAAMANFSPDGKWILFTEYDGVPVRAIGIFRMPAGGGEPVQLPTTGAIDEFHCPASSAGSCVIRETVGTEFVFYALDPVRGMGQELGRMKRQPTVIGDWSISPDGSTLAMADHDPDHPAIQLVPLSAHGSGPVSSIPVRGFGVVRDATWAPDAKGFYVETKAASVYDLLYVDRAGHATVLRQSPNSIWGVPSRDGKKLAYPALTTRSNVWIGTAGLATSDR